jgi:Zn-dependent protease
MEIVIFSIAVLIMSAVMHEYMHGWVAYKLGDNTAKDMGRLTLNPVNHLDPIGSIILPLLLVLSKTGFIIGWAKPVPYNPYNLRDPKYGDLKVAIGGPGTNLAIAIIFGIVARLTPIAANIKQMLVIGFLRGDYDYLLGQMHGSLINSIFILSGIICFINLLLMIFNLIPIPPLDGSKVLMTFLPFNWQIRMHRIEPYGFFIIIFLLMFGLFSLIWPVLLFLFTMIVGIS